MAISAARDRLLDRVLELTPEEFEVLCKIVLADGLQTSDLNVTPASQDGGIDIAGRLSYEWFAADFGVQVKRYSPGNTVGNDRIHRLAGALRENGYHLGTFVTTSSYTGPAKKAARDLPIQLVSGVEFADSMLRSGIGVTEVGSEYELEATFWHELDRTDERISAGEVPLANNLDRVRDVLRAIQHTDGTCASIRQWATENANLNLSDRHARINANSTTVLGLARKEPPAPGHRATRYGLTKSGAEYLSESPESADAQTILQRAIRGVELVERVRSEVAKNGELSTAEIDELLADETAGLSDSSVRRRSSAIRTWLAVLPEIEVEKSGRSKSYVYAD